MAGTHNFKVFDETQANMTPDASYSADAARLAGAQPNSVADPLPANKAWHQATIMTAAIAQYVANQGISTDDTNLSNLVTALAGSIASLSGISYADRTAHGLLGSADIGTISYCAAQLIPAAATYTASGTGNLNGSYHYREVLISGYINQDGTRFVRGFSPAASRSTADVSPSSQQVSITNLPVGAVGCIGRAIYRSAAGGAAGTEQFCGIIWDNTATTYTDNLVDSQLGTGMPVVQGTAIPAAVPTTNTTGTTNASSVPVIRKVNGYTLGAGDVALNAADVGAINPNLLVNTDFTAPINGLGQSSYSAAGPTIDKWTFNSVYAALTVNSGYIAVAKTSTAGTPYFLQAIDNYKSLLGKVVTYSVGLLDGTVSKASVPVPTSGVVDTSQIHIGSTNWQVGLNGNTSTGINLRFYNALGSVGDTMNLVWVKLEIGPTATTFSPSPREQELALCGYSAGSVALTTPGQRNIMIIGKSDTIPTGLPDGTVILRKQS